MSVPRLRHSSAALRTHGHDLGLPGEPRLRPLIRQESHRQWTGVHNAHAGAPQLPASVR